MVDDHHRRDAYVSYLIRRKARLLSCSPGFRLHERPDFEHDLWAHLKHRERHYDPSRQASFETFAHWVVSNKTTSIARHRKAAMRNPEREEMSLNQMVSSGNGNGDDGEIEASQTIADPGSPAPDANDLQHDLDAVVSMLTPRQQRILKLLPQRMAKARLAEAVDLTLDELEQELAAIKACFTKHEMQLYLA
ncbi:MAG: hypothetical protein WD534_09460 [Phycisphaeraceae bacterium]